jgi:hypothetical protein
MGASLADPQSGKVTAVTNNYCEEVWASALNSDANSDGNCINGGLHDSNSSAPVTAPGNAIGDTASPTTCYDFSVGNLLPLTYSMGGNVSPNNSAQVNCTLTFQFQ